MTLDSSGVRRSRWRLLTPGEPDRRNRLATGADRLVERLNLSREPAWDELQAAVEGLYGKRIYLVSSDSTALKTVTGLWIDTGDLGVIVFREQDESHYQTQNAFHELAHVLLAYAPAAWLPDGLPRVPRTRLTGATELCASTRGTPTPEMQAELVVEEVAFAFARRLNVLHRTSDETFFG